MSTDLEQFLGGKTKTAKFQDGAYGSVIGGEIVADPKMVQQRDYDTDELMFFPDGNPQMQMIVKVQAQPATGDDDGVRAFYVKGQLREAVIDALKAVGAKVPARGGDLQVKYLRDEPVTLKNGKRGNPKKIHAARYTPPTGPAGAFLTEPTTPVTQTFATGSAAPSNGQGLACPPGVTPDNWQRMNPAQQAQMYDALGLPSGSALQAPAPIGGPAFFDEPPF